MTPTFEAPGTDRLKLKYDGPLANGAFKFNLRRFNLAKAAAGAAAAEAAKAGAYTLSHFSST